MQATTLNAPRPKKFGIKLLLLIVFSLNATIGYGACCGAMASSVASTAEAMPCHDMGEEQPSNSDMSAADLSDANLTMDSSERCCAACVSIAFPFSFDKELPTLNQTQPAPLKGTLVTANFPPPFRPPIAHLS